MVVVVAFVLLVVVVFAVMVVMIVVVPLLLFLPSCINILSSFLPSLIALSFLPSYLG